MEGVTQMTAFGDLRRVSSVVLFAGGGGSCTGIEQATGCSPLAAINHCASALRIHALNHPTTTHDRFGLVTIRPDGRIAYRMLAVGEYAASMGFPPGYRLVGTHAERMRAVGNAVCPPMARLLVAANMDVRA